MRFTISLLIDVILILLGTVAAIVLRDNFDFSAERIAALAPYFLSTVIACVIVFPLFGVNRAFWRFSAMPDYLRVSGALLTVVVASVAMTFAFDRLENAPRALPFLQFNVALILLVGARVLYRLNHGARRSRRSSMRPLKVVEEPVVQTLLLVGLSRLTETYLQSIAELAPPGVKVAGILGQRDRHIGRLVAAHKVLGLPDHVGRVISELDVSGIKIDRIVITSSVASLSAAAREALDRIQLSGSIQVQYLSADLGFETRSSMVPAGAAEVRDEAAEIGITFEIETAELHQLQRRRYWPVKRALDIAGSLALLAITSPVLLVVSAAVVANTGWPLVFWQQRPGLGGRAFRLYKFRSMGEALAPDGRRLSDEERASLIGNFLRRTRLDELPQLFNILRGDMSFIGPRPLLPRDQDHAYRARLLVRPGLTGWAQVVGGRAISAADKAALDIWYVRNASLLLDVAIILRTIPMVLVGERMSEGLIQRAWNDLQQAGVLKAGFPAASDLRNPATI